jgi:hypothetical protein
MKGAGVSAALSGSTLVVGERFVAQRSGQHLGQRAASESSHMWAMTLSWLRPITQ